MKTKTVLIIIILLLLSNVSAIYAEKPNEDNSISAEEIKSVSEDTFDIINKTIMKNFIIVLIAGTIAISITLYFSKE